ncbi:serine/threonine-protein kinase [Micromonospora sp. NPDC052213]|uniref:serine/threonine-protein kinase n=1 Tax=Micromonospora sp. NPDC052213 TaxID=3155812 RepID=UPI0034291314
MTGLAGAPVPGLTPLWTHDPVTAGPYRLVGRLGAGGQGVVYLGEDDQGHRVAVKMINIDLRDPRARSQFTKEIAAARRVAPFCTAQVLFAEVDGEPPYVVSEFIEGPTLHRHVREHGTVNGNALHRLAVGTATALAAIHRSDVVHCDLKPDNVVLGRDGPRVIDFGIARALGVTETATSRVMGTTAYMAPERFRNDAVAPPCDVFAWAATIAFAASGRPPFGNDSPFAVMHRVLNDPPDLPPLPPGLEELIRECLAKEPADRPAAEQVLIRLLGQDVRVSGRVRQENLLQMGNDTAGAPTTNEPLPTSATRQAQPTRVAPRQARPTPPEQPPASTSDTPTASSRPVEGWGQRLRRESVDPWGVSTAIVLGSGGAAAGYVASSAVGVAAALGTATFVVVYLVRLLVATALGGGASDRL